MRCQEAYFQCVVEVDMMQDCVISGNYQQVRQQTGRSIIRALNPMAPSTTHKLSFRTRYGLVQVYTCTLLYFFVYFFVKNTVQYASTLRPAPYSSNYHTEL